MSPEQEHDSQDEIELFIYGRIMCSMAAVWRMYGYQDYPAPDPPVCVFKVRTGDQLEDFKVMSLIYKYTIIDQRYYMVSSTLSFWCGTILHQSYQNFIKITVL